MNGYEHLITKTARAIASRDFLEWFMTYKNLSFSEARLEMVEDDLRERFVNRFREWTTSAKHSAMYGLDGFEKAVITNSITHSLDCFVSYYDNKRIRVFKGEYPYVKRLLEFHGRKVTYIEDEGIRYGDVLLVSYPFSATGDKHPHLFSTLTKCDEHDVPVFIDCAFWPACYDVPIILQHECIKHVAFSFSKSFPMSGVRIGIEFLRKNTPHQLDILTLNHYYNRLGAYVGLKLMNRFEPDSVVDRYKVAQHDVCGMLDMMPSKTIIFGLSNNSLWNEYSRDGIVNRPCITKALEQLMGDRIR